MQFKPGYCRVLDEFNPADGTQAIYMSENMMKVLLAPQIPGTVRCRNDDKILPMGMPCIFTGNPAQSCCLEHHEAVVHGFLAEPGAELQ